jgi:ferrochelatase
MTTPFDAVLVIAFGGPQGLADIRPFLANVLRGRRVAPGRVEEVAHHYELFGGVSPLPAVTAHQADGLRQRLSASGVPLPVYTGMRNWHPYLQDTLAEMSRAGVRRAVGFIAAAHRSYSGCLQYKENVDGARASLAREALPDVEITYVSDWHTHPLFIAANAARAHQALAQLPIGLQDRATLIFTAHSIPVTMAEQYPYQEQFEQTARLVAAEVNGARPRGAQLPYVTVYQSRSGRPEDPWLGPDVCDYLRESVTSGLSAAVVCPVGFLVDHVEVLYDLDTEAAAVANELGLPIIRARTVGDDPRFLDMMADIVLRTVRRYRGGRPLRVGPEARMQTA